MPTRLRCPLPLPLPLPLLVVLAFTPWTAGAALTPVDHEDETTLETSASLAFYEYLQAIDAGELAEAYEMALEPVGMDAQDELLTQLSGFIKARQKKAVTNEAMIIRSSGDWAMVVYQYDTTVAGKPARVITTAWMLQWEGFWRQFIVAPEDERFWDNRRSDYERLQNWFDDNAEALESTA